MGHIPLTGVVTRTPDPFAAGDYLDPHASTAGFIYDSFGHGSTQEAGIPSDAAINPKAQFHDIDCPSAYWCAAVKTYTTNTGHHRSAVDIVSTDAPSTPDLPVPAGTIDTDVETVSCGAQAACAAVGTYTDAGGVAHALLETLSGTSWTAKRAALPSGADPSGPSDLQDVSCPTSGFCVAVGSSP